MESVNIRYSGIWKLLNDYNFDGNKRYYPDLICVICNKLLRNAHQTECGCRYCLECIQLYCQNSDKSCPGKTEECSEKIIDLLKDIQEDYTANKKLSMITVTCPILNCQYTDYLMDMEKHIQSHQVECPYVGIGCEFHKDIIQNVNVHLNQESYAHSQLVSQSIIDLKINMFPMIEKLHRNHAEEMNEYFFNSFKTQQDKIANLQSENEQFRKQLESLFNQSQIKSISSSDLSSIVSKDDHSIISKPQNELSGLEKVVTTITINNNNAHLENITCSDNHNNNNNNMQILLNDFSIFKFQTNNELSSYKENQKKINNDIKSLQILCKHFNKSKDSHSHSSSVKTLELCLHECHYEIDKMQTVRRKSEKTNDEMKKSNEKCHTNIEEILQKMKKMQRDIVRIERNSSLEDIEKFNKVLKDYFSDSEKLHEKFVVYEDELELSKRDNEKILIKCHSNQKKLSTVKESLGNFEKKFDKFSSYIEKINEKFIRIEQKQKSDSGSSFEKIIDSGSSFEKIIDSGSSFEKIIDLEAYETVIDNSQIEKKNIAESNKSFVENNNSPKINQKEIMDYLERCKSDNEKEMGNTFNKINEDINDIKQTLIEFQLENTFTKRYYGNIDDQQLKINNRLMEIDEKLHKHSIDRDNINDFINKTIKEMSEMKNTTGKCQTDTNSIQMDIRKSSENFRSAIENMKGKMETCLSNQNKLQNENTLLNQDINLIKSELKTNSTDIGNMNFFFVECEQRFDNIKNDMMINYDKIEMLKSNSADSWENIKRISRDLEKLSQEQNLLHKLYEDLRKPVVGESKSVENFINKLKEENLKMEIQNKNNFKIFRKKVICDLKESKTNIEKLSDQMEILQRKSDLSHGNLNEAIVLQNSKIEKIDHAFSNIQSLEKHQNELNKKFDTISKMFRNLKTECLNRRSEIISPIVVKRQNTSREWLVENFQSRFKDAQEGHAPYITSEWFDFIDYKVGFKLYPNGDSFAKDQYLSIFCFIKKRIENLPQRRFKLLISLVDRVNSTESITKEYGYCNFIKQESTVDTIHNEMGTSDFILLDILFNNSSFIENDSILFRYSIAPLINN